jgi:hypothetical protein
MKQNKKAKICAVFCFAGKRKSLFLYLWCDGGKKKKALLITTHRTQDTQHMPHDTWAQVPHPPFLLTHISIHISWPQASYPKLETGKLETDEKGGGTWAWRGGWWGGIHLVGIDPVQFCPFSKIHGPVFEPRVSKLLGIGLRKIKRANIHPLISVHAPIAGRHRQGQKPRSLTIATH